MKEFFNKEIYLFSLISLVIVGLVTYTYFLFQEMTSGFLLLCISILLIILTLFFGTVMGLFGSLIVIFTIGSIVLFFTFSNSDIIEISIPLLHLFMYGVSLVVFILLTGTIHNNIEQKNKERQKLQFEIEQFVAIDPSTGFDNKTRMIHEVQSEMNRVKRYGGAFTLILLQIDHFDEFEKLYGMKEKEHLLQTLAGKIDSTMRSTDRKFRYAPDRIALVLTNTDDQSVDIVYNKILESLKTHQLLSEKYITLTFHGSHAVYTKEQSNNDFEQFFNQVESELMIYAL